jgi:hypothetical protein
MFYICSRAAPIKGKPGCLVPTKPFSPATLLVMCRRECDVSCVGRKSDGES